MQIEESGETTRGNESLREEREGREGNGKDKVSRREKEYTVIDCIGSYGSKEGDEEEREEER